MRGTFALDATPKIQIAKIAQRCHVKVASTQFYCTDRRRNCDCAIFKMLKNLSSFFSETNKLSHRCKALRRNLHRLVMDLENLSAYYCRFIVVKLTVVLSTDTVGDICCKKNRKKRDNTRDNSRAVQRTSIFGDWARTSRKYSPTGCRKGDQ